MPSILESRYAVQIRLDASRVLSTRLKKSAKTFDMRDCLHGVRQKKKATKLSFGRLQFAEYTVCRVLPLRMINHTLRLRMA